MTIYALGQWAPEFRTKNFWVADNATLIGQVSLGDHTSIWFGVVARGDLEPLTIGNYSNVQDNSVLHSDTGYPLVIGDWVTVGHSVMLHGCTIGDNTLIGIGSTVLNGAVIGKNCIIGANALITENKVIPDGSLVLGSPGKVVRQLTPEDIASTRQNAQNYVDNYQRYIRDLKKIRD